MFNYLYTMGKAKVQQCFRGIKGQGLTEYAVILGIVVLIAIAIQQGDGFSAQVEALYTNVGLKLQELATDVHNGLAS